MISEMTSKALGRYLILGTPFVSVFLLIGVGTDPVNVTKLFVLGGTGIGILGILLFFCLRATWTSNKALIILSILFMLSMVNSLIHSPSPFLQNFFGVYGRNGGFATYFLLTIFLIGASSRLPMESYTKLIFALFSAGFINILYCGWVLIFGDFVGWYNPYKVILGLLGNPDFISAFLGMTVVGMIAYIIKPGLPFKNRTIYFLACLVALIEIKSSHAIQGLVVTALGIVVVGFFYLKSLNLRPFLTTGYLFISIAAAFLAILGALQHGPLSFIYKRSVSLRGSYWHAGLEMGLKHPFSGIGMDSYGDWYRRTRPPQALVDMPGVNTMSNVSHNVIIDFFAYGGFPLVISYLGLIALTAVSIIRYVRFNKRYDAIFVALTTVWIAYQAQSVISINQIGLAIWGWVFGGALISYVQIQMSPPSTMSRTEKLKVNRKGQFFTPALTGGIFSILGLIIFSGPLAQDARWFSATKSQDVRQVEKALKSSFMNPVGASRYLDAVDLFYRSGLQEKALEYSREAVKYNPEFFDLWRQMYGLDITPTFEKANALRKMKELDPLNPDVTQK